MKKVIALLITLCLSSQAWATTVTFQDGVNSYTGQINARIISGSTNEQDTTEGGNQKFNTGGNTWIIRFDLSSIPSNATVTAATMTIQATETNCTSGVHMKLTNILNPDNSGAWTVWPSAQDNFNQHATWHYKDHGSTTKWSTAGGNVSFADVNTGTAESTVAIPACAALTGYTFSIPIMTQTWVSNANANGGAFFITDASQVATRGQYDGTTSNHPSMTITYTVPHQDTWNAKFNGTFQ